MRTVGKKPRRRVALLVSLLIIALAVVVMLYAVHRSGRYPSTDDASIEADVVHIAAPVGGRIVRIAVVENEFVVKGDLLFQIDPTPYRLAVAQAQADLNVARGARGSRERSIETEKSNASQAHEQVLRAQTNYALAQRTVTRLRPLAAKGYVTQQRFDQSRTAAQDAKTSLRQARKQEAATRAAVGSPEGATAAVQAREAALAIAQHALDNTTVVAPHDGRVVGLNVSSGEIVAPSQSLFTLIDTDHWFAAANFRETSLAGIHPGECATVYSMIDRGHAITGTVEGIGWGVLDASKINLPRSAPFVQRSLNWVRVAQRFPVRIRLKHPPEDLVRLGASAVVEIGHGDGCR